MGYGVRLRFVKLPLSPAMGGTKSVNQQLECYIAFKLVQTVRHFHSLIPNCLEVVSTARLGKPVDGAHRDGTSVDKDFSRKA
eukprot:5952839-Amphidinium_carterae.1